MDDFTVIYHPGVGQRALGVMVLDDVVTHILSPVRGDFEAHSNLLRKENPKLSKLYFECCALVTATNGDQLFAQPANMGDPPEGEPLVEVIRANEGQLKNSLDWDLSANVIAGMKRYVATQRRGGGIKDTRPDAGPTSDDQGRNP